MSIIEKANDAYYNKDEPIISDNEYDLLADDGLDIRNFRNKVKHHQPMGSLKKIKLKKEFDKWCKGKTLFVTPKLDGNSIEIVVDYNGKVIKSITRGDGYFGNDVTDKIKYCNIPYFPPIDTPDITRSFKCEAIMLKEHQRFYEKNIRNVVSGIINKKEVDVDDLSMIDIIPFCNLSEGTFEINNATYDELLKIYNDFINVYPYEIDGLVVQLDDEYHDENNELLPSNKIALKFNKKGVSAEIGNIEWNVGKYGRLTPVIVLSNPVDIDGSSISHVSASNYGIVKEAKLGIGAKIEVVKSGGIIPFITEVVEPVEFNNQVKCPECYSIATISENGIHAICEYCKKYDKLTKLKHIFKVLDVDYISDATIETLYNEGYYSLVSIFMAAKTEGAISNIDGFGKKTEDYIKTALSKAKLTEAQVIECAMVEGIGKKQSANLIERFGTLDKFLTMNDYEYSLIDGIGEIMSERIKQNKKVFISTYEDIVKCDIEVVGNEKKDEQQTKGNVAVTGKWKLKRKEIIDKLEEMGYTFHDGVKKDTNILLVEDVNSNSSKIKKARDKGITIVSYDEFFGE